VLDSQQAWGGRRGPHAYSEPHKPTSTRPLYRSDDAAEYEYRYIEDLSKVSSHAITPGSLISLTGEWSPFHPFCCAQHRMLYPVQITGPPPNLPPRHATTTTPTSTPLPNPTPLQPFAVPSPDRKPLYVPGSQAERQARLVRMSSPLRRGTHESWWTREMGFFNAVAKVC